VGKLEQRQYPIVGNNPTTWWESADNLKWSSIFLSDQCFAMQFHLGELTDATKTSPNDPRWGLAHVIRMLDGMAFECRLKAFWLLAGHTLVRDRKYQGVRVAGERVDTNHDLEALAQGVLAEYNYSLSEAQRKGLHHLSRMIAAGRYPIPRHEGKHQLAQGGFIPAEQKDGLVQLWEWMNDTYRERGGRWLRKPPPFDRSYMPSWMTDCSERSDHNAQGVADGDD